MIPLPLGERRRAAPTTPRQPSLPPATATAAPAASATVRRRIRATPSRKASPPRGRASAGCSGRGGRGRCCASTTSISATGGRPLASPSGRASVRCRRRSEFPPQYGLDHGLTVDDPEFLNTMAGAAGVPFLPGNSLALLNNGDRFYPVDARRDRAGGALDHDRGLHLLGRRDRAAVRERARRAARRGVRVKILLDAVGSASVGSEILQILEKGGCHVAWYNPIRWNHLRRINNRTHRKSLIVDGRIGFTGGAGIADHWTGDAQDDKHWRDLQIRIEGPGGAAAADRLRAELAGMRPASSSPGRILSGAGTGRSAVAADDHELAGDRRVHRARDVLPGDFGGARRRSTSPIRTSFPITSRSICSATPSKRGVRVRVMVAGASNDTMIARFNSVAALRRAARCGRRALRIQPHDDASQDHDGRRPVGDGRHGQLRQSIVLAQRGEQRLGADEAVALRADPDVRARPAVCDRVTKEAWRRRGLVHKTIEALASFVQDQV